MTLPIGFDPARIAQQQAAQREAAQRAQARPQSGFGAQMDARTGGEAALAARAYGAVNGARGPYKMNIPTAAPDPRAAPPPPGTYVDIRV